MDLWMFMGYQQTSLQGPTWLVHLCQAKPDKLKIVTSATVSKLITEGTKVRRHRGGAHAGLVIPPSIGISVPIMFGFPIGWMTIIHRYTMF